MIYYLLRAESHPRLIFIHNLDLKGDKFHEKDNIVFIDFVIFRIRQC